MLDVGNNFTQPSRASVVAQGNVVWAMDASIGIGRCFGPRWLETPWSIMILICVIDNVRKTS
jgi:hypothetical protein